MIAIVDYGAGNLTSVVKAIRHLGRECIVTSDANDVRAPTKADHSRGRQFSGRHSRWRVDRLPTRCKCHSDQEANARHLPWPAMDV